MTEVLTFSFNDIYDRLRTFCMIPTLIKKVVTCEVVFRACAEANINVEADELQQAVNDWRLKNKLDSVEATQSWLEKHYLSLQELGQLISAELLSDKLALHLFKDKVETYFLDYQLDHMQASMYEIVLDDEGIAMELFYAVCEKEINFFDAAYQYIHDVELRRIGGYRGVCYRKDLKPEVSAAVFADNSPRILEPIVTSTGVHLIKVIEVIKPQLNEAMRQKIISALFDTWITQKVEQFDVEIGK